MGVAIEIAFAQLCPGRPGVFDGKRSDTVGTFQEMSPMSSEPPPRRCSSGIGPRSGASVTASPSSFAFSSCWMPRASVWSASLHCGRPTALMFSSMFSDSVLLMCFGHAVPRIFHVTSVFVIIDAAFAMVLPISHSSLMCS